jgi:hypothetical protein
MISEQAMPLMDLDAELVESRFDLILSTMWLIDTTLPL